MDSPSFPYGNLLIYAFFYMPLNRDIMQQGQ